MSSASTYVIASSDEGKSIKAVISYQDGQGSDEVFNTISATIPSVENVIGDGSHAITGTCLLYTSPSPRDGHQSRMPSSA